ncbi:MAG: FAD-dependent oxidoreductase, partial [Bacteroidota bacterium]
AWHAMLKKYSVTVHLNTRADQETLTSNGFDEIILSTGVSPRRMEIEGIQHPMVLDYADVLYRKKPVGKRVAIIGAGGIGFDMAEYLAHDMAHEPVSLNVEAYMQEWGVDMEYNKGGSLAESPQPLPSPREIYLIKRSRGKHGKKLGKTTGWIHRASLAMKEVNMIAEAQYVKVDDEGLHILVNEEPRTLAVDNVVICAGQEPFRAMYDELEAQGLSVHLIGGANIAKALDAKKAIKEASVLASTI